jgi:hypothetical protein
MLRQLRDRAKLAGAEDLVANGASLTPLAGPVMSSAIGSTAKYWPVYCIGATPSSFA